MFEIKEYNLNSKKLEKTQKILKKSSFSQALLDGDINSTSGNFIFVTKIWNGVAVFCMYVSILSQAQASCWGLADYPLSS